MKHYIEKVIAIVLTLVIALSMAACGNKADNAKTTDAKAADTKTADTKTSEPPKEKTKVRVMSWWNFTDSKPLQELKAKFEAKNPDYELAFEQIASGYADKVLTVVAGGGDQVPDVMMLAMDVVPRFAKAGAIQELDSFMTDDYKKGLYPVALDAAKYNGKMYAAPRDITSFVMFCNKKMFDDAKVPLPKDGWTWDDFLDTAKKLTKVENGKSTQWGYYFPKNNDTIFTWLIQNGGDFTSPDCKTSILSNPESTEALQFLQDLINKHKVCPTDTEAKQFGTDSSAAFIAGKVAMQIGGLSNSVSFDNNKLDYVMVPLPKGKKVASTAFVNAWTIPKGAKNPKASWKVIEFFSGKEGQEIVLSTKMGLPASKSVSTDAFVKQRPDNKYLIDALGYSIPFRTLDNGAQYYDLVKKTLEKVWINQMTAKDAAKEIDDKGKSLLNAK